GRAEVCVCGWSKCVTSPTRRRSALRQKTLSPSRVSRSVVTSRTGATTVAGPTMVMSTPGRAGPRSSVSARAEIGAQTTASNATTRRSFKSRASRPESSGAAQFIQTFSGSGGGRRARKIPHQARPRLCFRRPVTELPLTAGAAEQRLLAERTRADVRQVRVEGAQRVRGLAEADQEVAHRDRCHLCLIRIGERGPQRAEESNRPSQIAVVPRPGGVGEQRRGGVGRRERGADAHRSCGG